MFSSFSVVTFFETGIVYGDWGLYDEISLYETSFTVYKTDGLVKKRIHRVKKINGKLN